MTQTNLISTDIQSLEIVDAYVDLFELNYSDTTTLYFHSGVSADVRVLSFNSTNNRVYLNSKQSIADGTTLTFTGKNASTGVVTTITGTVNGATTNSQQVVLDSSYGGTTTAATGWRGVIEVGFIVTGTGIRNDAYGEVVFNRNVYYGFPILMDGVEVQSDGAMNRPTLTMANVESILRTSSTFQNAFDADFATGQTPAGISGFNADKLVGKRLTRRRTLEKYLNVSQGRDADAAATKDIIELPKSVYVIDRIASIDSLVVTFELASPFDLAGMRIPRRAVIGKYCSWIYKGKKDITQGGNLTGTVHNSGSASATLTGIGTNFTDEVAANDLLLIDSKYLRTVKQVTNDTSLILLNNAPAIAQSGGGSATIEAGPVTFSIAKRINKGACSWRINSSLKKLIVTTEATMYGYITVNDEPLVHKGIAYNYNSGNGTWSVKSSAGTGEVVPSTYSEGMTTTTGSIFRHTTDGYEHLWLYTGDDTSNLSIAPVIGSVNWQLLRTYTLWTDRAFSIQSDTLNNDYVLYPYHSGSTEASIGFVDTSTIWRNTISLAAGSGEAPHKDSLFWAPGDVCGKTLNSCKSRYQYQPRIVGTDVGVNQVGQKTQPAVEKDTNALLPFGGFPGSRKFR